MANNTPKNKTTNFNIKNKDSDVFEKTSSISSSSFIPKTKIPTTPTSKLLFERSATFNILDKSHSTKNLLHQKVSTPSPLFKQHKSNSTTTLNQAFYTPSSLFNYSNNNNKIFNRNKLTPTRTPNSIKNLSSTPTSIKSKQRDLDSLESSSALNIKSKLCERESTSKDHLEYNNNITNSNNYTIKTKDALNSEISNLTVAIRVRPLNAKECKTPSITNIISVNNNDVIVSIGNSADNSAGVKHTFHYDEVYWSCNTNHVDYADQYTIFNGTALPLLDKAFEGYNACLFAYGQTGSGKSHSMMGIDIDDNNIDKHSDAGIIPRFCQELFQRIDKLKDKVHAEVEVSYFEIYNEKIHDLLAVMQASNSTTGNYLLHTPTNTTITHHQNNINKRTALRVREHPIWGPYIVDLSIHPVNSHLALRNWLAVGNSQRATYATGMNDKSSRSHSIFNIILNLSDINPLTGQIEKQTKRSKISLVDLAGSERVSNLQQQCSSSSANNIVNNGERLREGVSINKSLLTLGKVIAALSSVSSSTANTFVPYRDSVLTWLLRENLGGNSRTVMLATISPASVHLDETLSTLRYACQARTIINRVKVNEDPHDRQIRELKAEVERLQSLHQDYERQKRYSITNSIIQPPRKIIIETTSASATPTKTPPSSCVFDDTEVEALRLQLQDTERELAKAQRTWRERLDDADKIYQNEMKLLHQNGLALELSVAQKQPCLVNLSVDPMLSGTLLYILPEGVVKIGRSSAKTSKKPDIILDGPLVAHNHCTIENCHHQLFIKPDNIAFETFVNGELLTIKKQIFHMDRVIIGGSHYFRVSNPNCKKKLNQCIVDYHLAHQEILKEQEKRLRKELDAEKKQALLHIETERMENEKNYSEKLAKLEFDQFKYKCNKEMLETEKKALEKEYNYDSRTTAEYSEKNDDINSTFKFQPYQSNIIEKIKRLMEHPSDESLHYIKLKVKEATQHCHDLGRKFIEFKQSQICDEFGIFKAIVLIIDRKNQLIAEWPPARLNVWLDMIHDINIDCNDDLFNCVDCEWKDFNENELINSSFIDVHNENVHNQSLNSSNFNISLNLNSIKNAIFGKNSPPFLKSSLPKKQSIKKTLIYDDEDVNENENVNNVSRHNNSSYNNINNSNDKNKSFESQSLNYVKDIRKIMIKFKRLCNEEQENNNENCLGDNNVRTNKIMKIMNSLEQMEAISNDVRRFLVSESFIDKQSTTPSKSVRFLID